MRFIALLGTLLGCLFITGRSPSAAADEVSGANRFGSKQAFEAAQKTHELWKANRFAEAAVEAARGAEEMRRRRRTRAVLWYLNIVGGANYRTGNLSAALDAYVAERDLALQTGQAVEAANALANLSSLYLFVNDTGSALAAAEEACKLLVGGKHWDERSKTLLQLGRVLLARKEGARATPIFSRVIAEASSQNEANAWDWLGFELLDAGDPKSAENALVNAFRIRRLLRDPSLFATEQKLARAYLELGQPALAQRLIDAAFEHQPTDDTLVPPDMMYMTRGRIRRAQGDLAGALQDFMTAADAAERRWRKDGLHADSFRVGADMALDRLVYSSAVDAAAELYARSGKAEYAWTAWELCERNRSASLRLNVSGGIGWLKRVPQEYWTQVEQLQELEARQIEGSESASRSLDRAARIRTRLSEMEAVARRQEAGQIPPNGGSAMFFSGSSGNIVGNLEKVSHQNSLSDFRKVIGDSRRFVGFRLGDAASYRWVIDAKGMDFRLLPARREIAAEVRAFRSAVEQGGPDIAQTGRRVFEMLFSGIDEKDSKAWEIALDEELFELPLAALVCGRRNDGHPVYLIERRPVQAIPGAWAVGRQDTGVRQGFAGIGDGVYNTADERYADARRGSAIWFSLFPSMFAAERGPLQLARLFGSAEEVKRASSLVSGPSEVVTGVDATRARVLTALGRRPGTVHFAVHFVEDRGGEAAIVLGLRPDGFGKPRLQLLTSRDVATLDVAGSIVVLSGCSSGAGRVVPAAGLLGLARAWLSAGARAVVTTYWPTTDGTSELFERFYRRLSGSDGASPAAPVEALRQAQVDMLHAGGSMSGVRYWGAYQLMGRSN